MTLIRLMRRSLLLAQLKSFGNLLVMSILALFFVAFSDPFWMQGLFLICQFLHPRDLFFLEIILDSIFLPLVLIIIV